MLRASHNSFANVWKLARSLPPEHFQRSINSSICRTLPLFVRVHSCNGSAKNERVFAIQAFAIALICRNSAARLARAVPIPEARAIRPATQCDRSMCGGFR